MAEFFKVEHQMKCFHACYQGIHVCFHQSVLFNHLSSRGSHDHCLCKKTKKNLVAMRTLLMHWDGELCLIYSSRFQFSVSGAQLFSRQGPLELPEFGHGHKQSQD